MRNQEQAETTLWYTLGEVREAHARENDHPQREELLEQMMKRPTLPLVQVPRDHEKRLHQLAQSFPNFLPVFEWLQDQLALCALDQDDSPLDLPPLLIHGPPGIGKTRFLDVLAKTLRVEAEFVDGAALTAGFVLSGSSPSWNKSRQGIVLDRLLGGQAANPLFIVDELDKTGSDKRYPVDSVLLSLLESHTASKFRDEFAGVTIRAQRLNWMATANDPERIAAPLLDRFHVVNVAEPTGEQAKAVAESVFQALLLEYPAWGKHFQPSLDEVVLDRLAPVPPRRLKRLLMSACGRAAREGGRRPIRLTPAHLGNERIMLPSNLSERVH